MNTTIKAFVYCLLGWANMANAFDVVGQEIYDTYYSKVFNRVATLVSTVSKSSGYYQIEVFAISVKNDKHPQGFLELMKSSLPTIDKKLWTITFNQLPISEGICDQFNLTTCDQNDDYCYKPCFGNLPPQVMAFDSINNKIYFHYPTDDIGVEGNGPALLFEGDINKKEIKFLKIVGMGEKGSVSPNGRYFVTHGYSVIDIYDRVNKTWVAANQSENHYALDRNLLHHLDIKKWISDTQFTYVDSAKYFYNNAEEMPFIGAKEITYDISTKKKLSEKSISKNEYDDFIKSLPLQARYSP